MNINIQSNKNFYTRQNKPAFGATLHVSPEAEKTIATKLQSMGLIYEETGEKLGLISLSKNYGFFRPSLDNVKGLVARTKDRVKELTPNLPGEFHVEDDLSLSFKAPKKTYNRTKTGKKVHILPTMFLPGESPVQNLLESCLNLTRNDNKLHAITAQAIKKVVKGFIKEDSHFVKCRETLAGLPEALRQRKEALIGRFMQGGENAA